MVRLKYRYIIGQLLDEEDSMKIGETDLQGSIRVRSHVIRNIWSFVMQCCVSRKKYRNCLETVGLVSSAA